MAPPERSGSPARGRKRQYRWRRGRRGHPSDRVNLRYGSACRSDARPTDSVIGVHLRHLCCRSSDARRCGKRPHRWRRGCRGHPSDPVNLRYGPACRSDAMPTDSVIGVHLRHLCCRSSDARRCGKRQHRWRRDRRGHRDRQDAGPRRSGDPVNLGYGSACRSDARPTDSVIGVHLRHRCCRSSDARRCGQTGGTPASSNRN
jgi:hypothetical protein